jgi:mRNA interferase RelE/StbE
VFEVEIRDLAVEDLDGIPANLRARILRAVEARLATEPGRYGERLVQSLQGLWRIRVGDHRVVYEIDERAGKMTVWAIRHRRDVYREILRRWLRG